MASEKPELSEWPAWKAPLCVAVATFLAFLPSLQNHFVTWDDPENFLSNLSYRGLGVNHLCWMFGSSATMGNYIPVSWLTLGLDFRLWGMNPMGYHLTSLLFHTANAVLFFCLARLLIDLIRVPDTIEKQHHSILAASFAALFFAVHPLRVESVAWVTERRDVVSGFFFLLALIAYVRHAQGRRGAYALSLVSYALALLSKPIVVTLPLVLSLLDYYPLRRTKSFVLEKVPFYVLAIPAAGAAIYLQSRAKFMVSVDHLGLAQRFTLGIYGIGFYLWKTLFPLGLRPLYPLESGHGWIHLSWMASVCFVLLLSGAAWTYRRRCPAFCASWVYYLVMILPISGLFLTGRQRAADRYSYLSCMAWALLAGWAFSGPSKARRMAGGILIAVLMGLTLKQCRVWATSESLWVTELSSFPDSYLAHNNLAAYYQGTGRLGESIHHYEEVIRIKPDFAEAQNNWGIALQQEGKMAEAIPHFKEAIRLSPRYGPSYAGLGLSLLVAHHAKEAIGYLKQALEINPDDAPARANLAIALQGIQNARVEIPGDSQFAAGMELEKKSRWAEAGVQFESAVEQNPKNADAFYYLGYTRAMLGRQEEALGFFKKALAVNPRHALANNYVGAMIISQHQPQEAIPYFERALEVQPRFADAENNWGVALASQRRFEEAILHFKKALEDDPTLAKARQNVEMAERFLAASGTP